MNVYIQYLVHNLFYHHFIKKNKSYMISTQKQSSKSKQKKKIDECIISYNATCLYTDIGLHVNLRCQVFSNKVKNQVHGYDCKAKNPNFRTKDKKSRCEQHWSAEMLTFAMHRKVGSDLIFACTIT